MAAIIAVGCDQKPAAAPPAPPPPPVTVSVPLQKDVIEWDTYTGHLESPESASVSARVSGLVVQMPFTEGAIVKKGDVLAVIDDRPFKADLDAKLADQQKAAATLAINQVTYNRLVGVAKINGVSQQEVDTAKSAVDQAAAALASAKAAVELSQLNLDWCRVLSPIDGRVGSKLVTVGNLVNAGANGAGQATILTTIQSVTPMYCYVDVDEHSVLKYQKLEAEGKLASPRGGKVPCYIQLGNEFGFPREGFIDFVDNHVDPTTGTERVRGVLDNASGQLTPGFFARLRIPGSGRYKAMLVPLTIIGNDQDRRTVLVVNASNIVEVRVVQLGALFGNLQSIASGLAPTDRVIINGQMHARPGAPVTPIEGKIAVDEAAFTDPGAAVAAPAQDTNPTTQPATGTRP